MTTTAAPPQTEADFMAAVTDYADLMGWSWVHFRPAMSQKGNWLVHVQGPMGKGWPDLVLARGSRLVFAELKRQGMKLKDHQAIVLATLRLTGAECYIWWPVDWPEIERVLQ